MSPITALVAALVLFGIYTVFVLWRGVAAAKAEGEPVAPTAGGIATGAVTNFFDTLGIGSFAPTTTIFRMSKMVSDEKIPGTLNAGHTLPTIVEALIFTTAIGVDPRTLILMIIAAVAGAWIGAGWFAKWPRRLIQLGMGAALLVAAGLMVYKALRGDPAGGTLLRLDGSLLLVGLAGNFLLGVLMTIGIGLYGPCMLLIAMLGMDPHAAFPIMMGSCAFLMPIASGRFVKEKSVNIPAALGLAIGGIPFVVIAAKLVKSMNLSVVRWLVVVVVFYTAVSLLLAARREAAAKATKGVVPA